MHDTESDWKKFTKLKKIALERFCQSVLDESQRLCIKDNSTAHEKYLSLYGTIQKRDKELGRAFDGHSRSKANLQLREMYNKGLVTDDELSLFSNRAQEFVRS